MSENGEEKPAHRASPSRCNMLCFTANIVMLVPPLTVTGLAIALGREFGAEIVSADSRQFYRGIPIGTAQPSREERAQAPHHFIDFLSLDEEYSSGRFADEAVSWLEAYFSARQETGRPSIAIMVGGSGLYTQAVQDGFDTMPADPEVREQLNALYASEGLDPLVAELARVDPEHHRLVDLANPHRVIRALEVCRISGGTYTGFRQLHEGRRQRHPGGWSRSEGRPWDTLTIGLGAPRAFLHDRINLRVHAMLEAGWLDEARNVLPYREVNALRTVGYPQLFDVLEGNMDIATATRRIQEATRQFARRQLTWFHRQPDVLWVDARAPERAVEMVLDFIRDGRI